MIRKYANLLLLFALSAAVLLTGCEKKRDALMVGIDTEFPPFSYTDGDGSYIGFDVELAEALCRLEGWTMKPVPISWDEKDTLLNAGSIDCIWSGFTINGRENDYTISIPYCDNAYVIAVSAGSGIRGREDLAGKAVGVQAASSGAAYLTEDEEGKALARTFKLLSQFSDFGLSFDALGEGILDAIIADRQTAEYFARQTGTFRILDEAVVREQYGVAMKKGDQALCDTINADLEKLVADGTVLRLAQKYGIEDSICIGNS